MWATKQWETQRTEKKKMLKCTQVKCLAFQLVGRTVGIFILKIFFNILYIV